MPDYLYKLATDEYRGFWAAVPKIFLLILSWIYGLLIRVLILLRQLRLRRLNCKVVSVGNITVGGTGKTALVELIARYLKDQGRKVAILTRGYKRNAPCSILQAAVDQSMGDEPLMLAGRLEGVPVIVDADRRRAAERAIRQYGTDTAVLDDGFQQWQIKKDLEIVTVDATDPFGNRNMLPRGILREPLSSLKRADIFILTKTNLNPDVEDIKSALAEINPRAALFESAHVPVGFYEIQAPGRILSLNIFRGKTVALFCGIGDPDSFENLISSNGINAGLSFKFPDHHHYTPADLENIVRRAKEKGIDTVITTEKDAARLDELGALSLGLAVYVLRIELKIVKDEQGFFNRLLGLYRL